MQESIRIPRDWQVRRGVKNRSLNHSTSQIIDKTIRVQSTSNIRSPLNCSSIFEAENSEMFAMNMRSFQAQSGLGRRISDLNTSKLKFYSKLRNTRDRYFGNRSLGTEEILYEPGLKEFLDADLQVQLRIRARVNEVVSLEMNVPQAFDLYGGSSKTLSLPLEQTYKVLLLRMIIRY